MGATVPNGHWPMKPEGEQWSRVFDIALGIPMLFSALPVLVIACFAIVVSDGFPVLHGRRVLGLGGSEFTAYKLRTMRVDADQWLQEHPGLLDRYQVHTKLEDDPRVTPIGRLLRHFHIDELPQLVNVLAGQMSIVGPRMIHPSELVRYGDFAHRRLSTKPGMTGPWQISKNLSYEYGDRIELDRWYLDRRSVLLNLWVLVHTPLALLGRRVDFGPILGASRTQLSQG